MEFIHPGKKFLENHQRVESIEDIISAYVDFLKNESGVNEKLPIDLDAISRHFHIPEVIHKPLPGIQGILFNSENGIIFVNSSDPSSRQKFSHAHELIELLFSVLPNERYIGNGWKVNKPGGYTESFKEYICNLAAANLLMPNEYVKNIIEQQGINFDSARLISNECEVSLSAALVHLSHLSERKHIVVLWKLKNKPTEIKNKIGENQLGLFDNIKPVPIKKLRVEWSMGSKNAPFIPKDKSVEDSSLIYEAWSSGKFTSGDERLCLDGRKLARYQTQNLPFSHEGETQVLSLLECLS